MLFVGLEILIRGSSTLIPVITIGCSGKVRAKSILFCFEIQTFFILANNYQEDKCRKVLESMYRCCLRKGAQSNSCVGIIVPDAFKAAYDLEIQQQTPQQKKK